MSGLPDEMINRWHDRAEPAAGEGLIYWHMLVGADPDVHALALEARRRLAPFAGLHLTPPEWLHMTVLIAGLASEIDSDGRSGWLSPRRGCWRTCRRSRSPSEGSSTTRRRLCWPPGQPMRSCPSSKPP